MENVFSLKKPLVLSLSVMCTDTISASFSPSSVSYTHLDVYKRQGVVRAAEHDEVDLAGGGGEHVFTLFEIFVGEHAFRRGDFPVAESRLDRRRFGGYPDHVIHRDRAARRRLRAEIEEIFLRRTDGLFKSEHWDAVAGDLAQTVSEDCLLYTSQAWAAQPLKPILKNGICCDDDGFSGLSTVIKERMFAVRRDVSAVAGRDFIRFIVNIERQIPFQYVKTLLPFVYRIIYL